MPRPHLYWLADCRRRIVAAARPARSVECLSTEDEPGAIAIAK